MKNPLHSFHTPYIRFMNDTIDDYNNSRENKIIPKIKHNTPQFFAFTEIPHLQWTIQQITSLAKIYSQWEHLKSSLQEFTISTNALINKLNIDNQTRNTLHELRDLLYENIEISFHNREVKATFKKIFIDTKIKVESIFKK